MSGISHDISDDAYFDRSSHTAATESVNPSATLGNISLLAVEVPRDILA